VIGLYGKLACSYAYEPGGFSSMFVPFGCDILRSVGCVSKKRSPLSSLTATLPAFFLSQVKKI